MSAHLYGQIQGLIVLAAAVVLVVVVAIRWFS
jgi:hypothetical protein